MFNRRSGFFKKLLGTSALLGMLVVIFYSGPSISTIGSYLTYPIIKLQAITVTPIRSWYTSWCERRQSYDDLQEAYKMLFDAYADLQNEYGQQLAVADCYEGIRELDVFRTTRKQQGYIARVLLKTLTPHEQTLLLDTGEQDGIANDMVVVHGNNLVGLVVDTYPWYCKVRLVTDKNSRVAAYCAKTKARGIYTGNNDSARALLHHVDHLKKVRVGDLVLSSGNGLRFPRGLTLGKISQATSSGICYDIDLQPVVNVAQLEYCSILRR